MDHGRSVDSKFSDAFGDTENSKVMVSREGVAKVCACNYARRRTAELIIYPIPRHSSKESHVVTDCKNSGSCGLYMQFGRIN